MKMTNSVSFQQQLVTKGIFNGSGKVALCRALRTTDKMRLVASPGSLSFPGLWQVANVNGK